MLLTGLSDGVQEGAANCCCQKSMAHNPQLAARRLLSKNRAAWSCSLYVCDCNGNPSHATCGPVFPISSHADDRTAEGTAWHTCIIKI